MWYVARGLVWTLQLPNNTEKGKETRRRGRLRLSNRRAPHGEISDCKSLQKKVAGANPQ